MGAFCFTPRTHACTHALTYVRTSDGEFSVLAAENTYGATKLLPTDNYFTYPTTELLPTALKYYLWYDIYFQQGLAVTPIASRKGDSHLSCRRAAAMLPMTAAPLCVVLSPCCRPLKHILGYYILQTCLASMVGKGAEQAQRRMPKRTALQAQETISIHLLVCRPYKLLLLLFLQLLHRQWYHHHHLQYLQL